MKRWGLGIALLLVAGVAAVAGAGVFAVAQEDGQMNNARLDKLIREAKGIEGEIKGKPGFWEFRFRGHKIYVITDESADRMRIMTPVASAEGLTQEALFRAMQANFDTALDARYAIAQGALWSAFIHPLSPLGDAEFQSGLSQVATLAATYGTTYNSGALRFGGGDTPPEGKSKPNGKGKTL